MDGHDEVTQEVMDRLRHLARDSTAGSRPLPRMTAALRRDRRARRARAGSLALTGAVVAIVVGIEMLISPVPGPDHRATPVSGPAPTARATRTAAPEPDSGYPERTTGSLAQDTTWLAQLRRRVRASDDAVGGDGDVRVVTAGDVTGRARYALVLYRTTEKGETYWTRSVWTGPARASAGDMSAQIVEGWPEPGLVPTGPVTLFTGTTAGAFVVISAPVADAARITTDRTFAVAADDPPSVTRERDVPEVSPGFWAGAVSENEYFLSESSLSAGGSGLTGQVMTDAPGYDDLGDVAADGTRVSDLERLGGALHEDLSPTLAEEPVYAETAPVGPDGQTAVLLLRTPAGGHVVAFSEYQVDSEHYTIWQGGVVSPAGTGTDRVMAGVYVQHDIQGQPVLRYLLVVPEGTAGVRVGNTTAVVDGRLVAVDIPKMSVNGGIVAEAVDEAGTVLARTTPKAVVREGIEKSAGYLDVPGSHLDGENIRP